ncbi:TIGR03084 family protein [Streptomyces echinoruber]|uniref:TIGR03084 family protein n=1 Tax=Streptomyces echinoruber TaxID=68898 RepID=A0A918REB4_9ACTN|nr:TIGR03084 family metal-binding protein [Streptomyces echinoruber]GGZ95187.1 TIGR03084 family protein [Streptomyces echinoruber]
MSDPTRVIDDLRGESEELDRLVGELGEDDWRRPTPAPGWSVAHQIAHLAWTDRGALLAVTDPGAFQELAAKAAAAPGTFVDEGAEEGTGLPPGRLLARWRAGRAALEAALRAAPPGVRFPWYGPPMSAASMASARLMETWAHGQDVADALGVVRAPTARLRHVVRIGVRARDYAFRAHGLTPPAEEFRVEVTAPDGERWAYGPEDAAQRVTGPALDFCLLVTQRAHRADLAVRAEGPDAERWLDVAQAFAGPPGAGRPPKGSAGPPQDVTRPPKEATRPPEKATRPPEKATHPPKSTTRPPENAAGPPQDATRPPQDAPRPPKETPR